MGDATVRAAAQAIAVGSQSFAVAARLFDREMRESAMMLYAWCRHCDDVIDGQDLGRPSERAAAPGDQLARLERETCAVLAGHPASGDAFDALARVVRRHAIPARYPLEHLDGFRMDVEGRHYQTPEAMLEYCYRVAGVVGVMMGYVMGARDDATLDRACDLGIAFQLTNIARDILPDAHQGRVYLPLDWLDQAGVPFAEIAQERHRPAIAGLAARLIALAEPYYDSAVVGIDRLPFRAAWAVATARGVYREIGLEVVRRGPHAWDARVSTSKRRKWDYVAFGCWMALKRPAPNIGRRHGLWSRPT